MREKERDSERQEEGDNGRDRKGEGGRMRVRERTCRHELLLAAIMAVFYYNASNCNHYNVLQNMCFIYVYTNHYHIDIGSVVREFCAIAESF